MASGIGLPGVREFARGDDFQRWFNSLEIYLEAANITEAKRKRAVLLHMMGVDNQEIFNSLPAVQGVTDVFEEAKKRLLGHFCPENNVIAERMSFRKMSMTATETFDEFVSRLRCQARRCGFSGTETDNQIRDQAIAGARLKLREKLIQQALDKGDGLTLQKVLTTAHVYEQTLKYSHVTSPQTQDQQQEVAAIHGRRSEETTRRQQPTAVKQQQRCSACGMTSHKVCPARGKTCLKCGKKNHYARCCLAGRQTKPQSVVHAVGGEHMLQDLNTTLWEVQSDASDRAHAHVVEPQLNGASVKMLLDTGSPVSIVSADVPVPGLKLQPTEMRLSSFTGHPIPLKGVAMVTVQLDGRRQELPLLVSRLEGRRAISDVTGWRLYR